MCISGDILDAVFHGLRWGEYEGCLTSLNTAFLPEYLGHVSSNSKSLFLFHYNHCLAVLCKLLGDSWAFWERDIFF